MRPRRHSALIARLVVDAPGRGVLIAHYYLVHKQKVIIDDMFTLDENGTYWYKKASLCIGCWPLGVGSPLSPYS